MPLKTDGDVTVIVVLSNMALEPEKKIPDTDDARFGIRGLLQAPTFLIHNAMSLTVVPVTESRTVIDAKGFEFIIETTSMLISDAFRHIST
jgi:hypothetical protein